MTKKLITFLKERFGKDFPAEETVRYSAIIAVVTVVLSVLCLIGKSGVIHGGKIRRGEPGAEPVKYSLLVDSKALEGSGRVEVTVNARKKSGTELEELLASAESYLDRAVLGDNPDADNVTAALDLVDTIPGTGIAVEWDSPDFQYIYSDGRLREENITGAVNIRISASLRYFDESYPYSLNLCLRPVAEDERTQFLKALKSALDEQDSGSSEDEYFLLPDEAAGQAVRWGEEEDRTWLVIVVLGIAAVAAVIPLQKEEARRKKEKDKAQMLRDYPDIISKFVMLLTAGMTCRRAWEKICSDYAAESRQQEKSGTSQKQAGSGLFALPGNKGKRKKKENRGRRAYEMMLATLSELELGIPETAAYERFGINSGLAEYQRFGTLISRNLRRGNRDIIELLEYEANEAFANRREGVKKQAEEAGTRLLFPMLGMFCIVVALILVPAFRTLAG